MDDLRCSCGFPETNVECESLLSGNTPTEAPSSGMLDSVVGGGDSSIGGEGAEDDRGTPTWVIVTAIALVSGCLFCWYV